MVDKALQPNLMDEIRTLRKELDLLKRVPRWYEQAFPTVPLGAVRDFGFTSLDSTSFVDLFRADVLATAPLLDYDIQTTTRYESTAVTSIEWQITGTVYFIDGDTPVTTAVLASGDSDSGTWDGSGDEQFQGSVDITDSSLLGPGAMFRLIRFDFEAKRTGGSGDGAALRMVRPPILRLPS